MSTTTTRTSLPTAQWVTVHDAQGLPRLEMRWSVPGTQAAVPLRAAA